MIRKRRSLRPNKVVVIFEIPHTIWAERINLVGDFNDWDRESLPFERTRAGDWRVEVELELGREYRFRYLVDGAHWRYDWHADNHAPSPHGGYDSIVIAAVPNSTASPEPLHDSVESCPSHPDASKFSPSPTKEYSQTVPEE